MMASNKAEPLVSVIMNGYNCEKYLSQSIESVLSQTHENLELIFWDNASSDKTGVIATGYGDRVRYFRSSVNETLGAARNKAIKKAKGSIIAFLDTDDYWLPDKLKNQVEEFKKNSNVDFIYTNFILLDERSGLIRKGLRRRQPSGHVFGKFLEYYPVNLQTVAIRFDALNLVDHLFDERFTISEEFDLFMRILYSAKALYLSDVTACYRIHNEMSSLKRMELFPYENSLILDKLLEKHPEIKYFHSSQVASFRGKLSFWQARASMHSNNAEGARLALRPFLYRSAKMSLLYFSTYNARIWTFLLKAYNLTK